MIAPSADTIEDGDVCGMCCGALLTTRYVYVEAASYSVVCSKACFRAAAREDRRDRRISRRRYTRRLTVGLVLAAAFLTPHQGPQSPASRKHAAAMAAARNEGPPPLPPGWFGPEWPPSEMSLLAALGRDTWIHPLAGPIRRMPRIDSRVFGAVRPGNRPYECRNGHCGVDLGGEIWGEHVHAVHDGMVDFVQRGANPDRGGSFVRIAHRDGTVFSWYFHLAAIPRGIERGTPVRSGDVVGLVGDTGVKQSAPHLHFALTMRPGKGWPERYIDPEPLIALWPLRVPIDGSEHGLVTTVGQPGLPLGSATRMAGHNNKSKPTKQERGADEAGTDEGGETSEDSDTGEGNPSARGRAHAPDDAARSAADAPGGESATEE